MARKTKKEKLLAELRRLKVIAQQKENFAKGVSYSIKETETFEKKQEIDTATTVDTTISKVEHSQLTFILKDLKRIIFLTAIFLGLQIILYLTLLRNL